MAIAKEQLLKKTSESKDRLRKYLIFKLANEYYGINVLQVQEIINMVAITRIPNMPDYVNGVINLRGKVVPVIDLRKRFGFKNIFDSTESCIVVIQVQDELNYTSNIGIMVNCVDEVVAVLDSEIEGNIDFCTSIDDEYIQGFTKVRGELRTILDMRIIRIG